MSMSVIARVIVLGVPLMLAVAAVPAHAQASVPVKVVNAKDAIQVLFTATLADGDSFAQTGTFTVPVGKRLVIEHLSGLARMQEQQRPAEVALTTTVNSVFAPHPLLLIEQSSGGTTGHTFVANHAVQIYGDPGTTVRFNFLRNTSTGDALFFATLSGYLVTFP